MWSVLSDPISMMVSGVDAMIEKIQEEMPLVLLITGTFVIFMFENVMTSLYFRFAVILAAVRKVLGFSGICP